MASVGNLISNNMEKKKMLISFSGGRTSGFMAYWLLKNKSDEYDFVCVFSNTGKENEQTLEFVEKCDKHFGLNLIWVEAVINPERGKGIRHKIIDFNTASRNGEPFHSLIAKHGLPNQGAPFCSERLKKNVIDDYLKTIGWQHCERAIGIRVDEIDRMRDERKKLRLVYPLIEFVKTTKYDVNEFWIKMPFDLELKSYQGNCDCCWKKSWRNLMTIAKENPEKFEWWNKMEEKYCDFIPEGSTNEKLHNSKRSFFRGNKSVKDIFEMAKHPFEMAVDVSKDIAKYKQLEFFDEQLDMSNGCEESCEAF